MHGGIRTFEKDSRLTIRAKAQGIVETPGALVGLENPQHNLREPARASFGHYLLAQEAANAATPMRWQHMDG